MEHVNGWCFRGIYKGGLWEDDLHVSAPIDSGYLHDGRADKNPYPHDRRADKDSYPHDSNNQCIILRLQLSFVMINEQMMLIIDFILFFDICSILQQICVNIIIYICA